MDTKQLKDIAERLKSFRKNELDLNQQDFAEGAGFTKGYISKIELAVQQPSTALLVGLAKAYNLSSDWILYGLGQMFLPEEDDPISYLDEEDLLLAATFKALPVSDMKKSIIRLFSAYVEEHVPPED